MHMYFNVQFNGTEQHERREAPRTNVFHLVGMGLLGDDERMEVTCSSGLVADPLRDLVPYGDRFALPKEWTVVATGTDLPCDIVMTLRPTTHHPEVVELTLRRREGEPSIRAGTLREVPYAKIQRIAVDLASWVRTPVGDGRISYGMTHLGEIKQGVNAVESDKRRRHDVDMAKVADVYRSGGRSPVIAVMSYFKVPRSTANKWIAESRRRGFLEPPTPRLRRS